MEVISRPGAGASVTVAFRYREDQPRVYRQKAINAAVLLAVSLGLTVHEHSSLYLALVLLSAAGLARYIVA